MPVSFVLVVVLFILVLVVIGKSIRIVPQKQAFLVERLGRYRAMHWRKRFMRANV